jgi:HK97 gp10 family phage protein
MSDDIVTLDGLEEIEQKLKALGPKLATKALKDALMAGGEVFQAAIEARAPYGPHWFKFTHEVVYGALRQSIDIKTEMMVLEDGGMVRVGPDRRVFWAKFAEFGTCREAAVPFIRPAFEESKMAALEAFCNTMADHLPDTVRGL